MQPATPQADSGASFLRVLMLVALYAVPVVVTLRPVGDPVFDPDIWWHLRTGQWIVDHRNVPGLDPFSQVDKPWVAYSWLYEVGVYGLYQAFGLAGIVVYRVGMALAITAALHRLIARREPRFLVATVLTAVAVLAIAMLFSERPWLFTILFSIVTLNAILDLREGRPTRLVPLLPFVFVGWANLHIQFVYGLGLLGLACVAPLLDRRFELGRQDDPDPTAAAAGSRAWRRLVGLTGLCCLGTLVNPYGIRLYQVVVEYAAQPGPYRFVNELKALEFREPSDWVMLALAAAAIFSLGRRDRPSSFDFLLLAVAAICAFRARRDLWFLVVASVVVLTPLRRSGKALAVRALSRLQIGCAVLALFGLAAATAWWRDLSPHHLDEKVAEKFPVGATRFIAASANLPGPIFNDFNWGGYLIWALPGRPVSLDGRTNLHGDERIQRYGSTWAGAPGWEVDPDLCRAGIVIAPVEIPLAALLAGDPRFLRVYEDNVACVFTARPEGHSRAQPVPDR